MRVEEERGAVERDRGLPCAGAAGDDEHAGKVGADHVVLLGLDRGDDVGHASGPPALERGEQRALADNLQARRLGGVTVEDLVVDAEQHPPLIRLG